LPAAAQVLPTYLMDKASGGIKPPIGGTGPVRAIVRGADAAAIRQNT
jgi:hypothetical protein